MTGSVQKIVVCQFQDGAPATTLCGANHVQVLHEAYVFDSMYANVIQASMEPVDAATASQVFLAAFAAVVTCFFVARAVGSVLDMIRK